MEEPQKELVNVLLKSLYSRGLISQSTYSSAVDSVHSATSFPNFFQPPIPSPKEADICEHTPDTK